MKLGVFIGSFNPVHEGHINMVNYLLEKGIVDRILIVPTTDYWDKTNLVDLKHRINMLKFFQNENIIIDETHNTFPYTCDLMKELSKEYDDELYLIIGADNIINFDKWKNYEELLQYKIIVMNRNNLNIDEYITKYNTSNFIVLSDYPFIDVSSTEIRNNLDNRYLDKRVLEYIKKNNLYKKED